MYSFSYLEPVCCSMSSSNSCFQTCIQISQEAGQVAWYSHLFQNFPQFIVIPTVKGFGIVNKAGIDVFLELSCFFDDPVDVGNLISGSSDETLEDSKHPGESPLCLRAAPCALWCKPARGAWVRGTECSFPFHIFHLHRVMSNKKSIFSWNRHYWHRVHSYEFIAPPNKFVQVEFYFLHFMINKTEI